MSSPIDQLDPLPPRRERCQPATSQPPGRPGGHAAATRRKNDQNPSPPPWLRSAAELASGLLEEGRLAALFFRPSVAAALARELHGVRCTGLSSSEQPEGGPPPSLPRANTTAPPPRRRRLERVIRGARAPDSGTGTGLRPEGAVDETSGVRPAPGTGRAVTQDAGLHVSDPADASCAVDGDCPGGEYCDSTHSCYECSYIDPGTCDDASGDCCSAAFLKQCPANPADCALCSGDGDCDVGSRCVVGRCEATAERQAQEKRALLQGFVRDPRGAAAWVALRGWSNECDPCGSFAGAQAWEGIGCDTTGRVDQVVMQEYPDLRFELLGSELAKLDRLSAFAVTGTAMSGTIPSELGGMSELDFVYLNSNPSLSGTIPSELGELTKLHYLLMRSTPLLSGTIPSELGGMSEIQDLLIHSNPSLSGTIPSELGGLSELQHLVMYSNLALSGSVPSLGGCKYLGVLDLQNCSLIGLPTSLPGSITHLYLNHNPIDAHPANLSSPLGSVSALPQPDTDARQCQVGLKADPCGSVGYQ